MRRPLGLLLLAWVLASGPAASGAEKASVTHNTFEDFSAGRLGDSGVNLYATRSGTLEMIHRWDLNNDGYLDILLGQDHDVLENADILVYWGRIGGPESILPDLPDHQPLARLLRQVRLREEGVTRLPSPGGGRSIVVDLNQDLYPELVFCNFIHNYSEDMAALIYWGGPNGYQPEHRTELPTILAGGVAAGDFNGDGFVDLAFSNRGIEAGERFGFDRHLESYVYWNGPRGFDTSRRSVVATVSAADCAAGDLDGDGYADLVFVNNNSRHKSVYLYRGGPEGISAERDEWVGGDPVGAHLADLDQDSHLDLALNHKDDRVALHRGSERGPAREPWIELPTQGAKQSRTGDLNRDGLPELVLPNSGGAASYVYWNGREGLSAGKRSELPTLAATDAVLADYDRDGWVDLVFANEYDQETYDVNTFLYWNGPDGFDAAHRKELQGFGPVSASGGDLNRDGHADLVLISRSSGSRGSIDSLIYWGNPRHHYSTAAVTAIPGTGGLMAKADLNQDGWIDLVFPAGRIFWGDPDGYSSDRTEELETGGYSVTTADLNRDGYLDLVVGAGSADSHTPDSTGLIRWGGEGGFHPDRSTRLPLRVRRPMVSSLADFNRDGFLDLVFTDVDAPNTEIFWGDESGSYDVKRRQHLKVHSASTAEIADLNADGWLDLILGAVYDPERFGRPMRKTTLLWGGSDGFSNRNSLVLESFESEEQAVADLNRDGFLDIVMTNYHGYTTRSLPVLIYWGGPDGSYSESRRATLPGESTLALSVADLNQDGWMDLIVVNHVERGDHAVGTNIFWGGEKGYSYSRRDWVQSFGPHFSTSHDVGNIYHRRLEEEYFSAPLEFREGMRPGRLEWTARTPHGTAVRYQIRSAVSAEALEQAAWKGPGGSESYFDKPGSEIRVGEKDRWLQYRVLFTTPDGGSTPVLEEVRLLAE